MVQKSKHVLSAEIKKSHAIRYATHSIKNKPIEKEKTFADKLREESDKYYSDEEEKQYKKISAKYKLVYSRMLHAAKKGQYIIEYSDDYFFLEKIQKFFEGLSFTSRIDLGNNRIFISWVKL